MKCLFIDIIYKKKAWINNIVSYLGWDIKQEHIDNLAARENVIPDSEDITKHIRQVHPEDYRNKLKPETIAYIDDYFEHEMSFFGYKPYSS